MPFSPRGLDRVGDWRRLVPRDTPLVCIGGITLEAAAGVVAAGADSIAVISALPAGDDLPDVVARWGEVWAAAGRC